MAKTTTIKVLTCSHRVLYNRVDMAMTVKVLTCSHRVLYRVCRI